MKSSKSVWKRFKKSGALLLVFVLLITSISACKGTNSSDSTQNVDTDKSNSANENNTEGFTTEVSDKPVEFSIMLSADASFNPEDNEWVKAINEAANADIEWIAYPIDSFDEKRNLAFNSGELPDVVYMSGKGDTLYDSLVKNQIIIPLNEYLKTAQNLLEYTNETCWALCTDEDENIYICPRSTIIREDFLVNRKDWRETLGHDVPETIDDWIELYADIATKDPDGNGDNDTYGISDYSNLILGGGYTTGMRFFARAWHADTEWYDDGNGNVFYGIFAEDGRFQHVLEFYNTLYENGSLDPDFIVNEGSSSVQDRWTSGHVSSQGVFAGHVDRQYVDLLKIQPEAEVEFMDFPVSDNSDLYADENLVVTDSGLYGGWALTKEAKDKAQEIINVFDWFLSDEGWSFLTNGVEGIHYNIAEDGTIVKDEKNFGQLSTWISSLQIFRRPNDESLWLSNYVPAIYDKQKEWLDFSVDYAKDYIQIGLVGIDVPKELEEAFYQSDVYTVELSEFMIDVIFGERPASDWVKFLDRIYESGWQDILDYYNEYYHANKE